MIALLFANTDWYLFNFRLPLARALRAEGFEVVLVSPRGPYGERLQAEGFRWIGLDMERRSLNPLREFRLLLSLSRLYRSEQPDIVHHFTIKCVIYGGIAAKIAGVKSRANAVAGLGYVFANKSLLARALRPFVRLLLRFSLGGSRSRLILQNADDVRDFERAGLIDPLHIRLIRSSGVNVQKFSPVLGGRADAQRIRVLFAARLLWDKGFAEYVEAAKIIRAGNANVDFLIAGSSDPGNPASVPSDVVDALVREGIVLALGHVNDMPQLLQEVDIVALPSYYREGVPKSLIEAAACGLPVITTKMPGCREVVEDGENGLLVPARDAKALADAIERLCKDAALRSEMGKKGRERAVREFDESIVIEKTLEVYRELIPFVRR